MPYYMVKYILEIKVEFYAITWKQITNIVIASKEDPALVGASWFYAIKRICIC